MLAYVFWHWPRPGVSVAEYEARQHDYQDALNARGPSVLKRSLVWRVEGAPWLPSGSGYEDWYLLDDSAALDVLNQGAVSGQMEASHSAIARLAVAGAAGLYQTRPDQPGSPDEATARWFAKPTGMPYPDFYARLGDAQSRLWRRMMVLGPTPEFCLLSASNDEPALPADWRPLVVRREPIWPMPAHP